MSLRASTIFAMNFMLLVLAAVASALPVKNAGDQDEKSVRYLETFLDAYYDEHHVSKVSKEIETIKTVEEPEEEMMQGDQPMEENSIVRQSPVLLNHSAANTSDFREDAYLQRERNRAYTDERARDLWKRTLMNNILAQIGRANNTNANNEALGSVDGSIQEISEKVRSYYPACEQPKNTDDELWKNENEMNLYFNLHQTEGNIATAILRLYRLAPINDSNLDTCKDNDDEEKLYKVTSYYYTKSLKKKGSKRRLCDSKVFSEKSPWVELSVRPAAKAWTSGKNLGLVVVLEDQDGNSIAPLAYFKGPVCMVGASTPKPIPTMVVDKVFTNGGGSILLPTAPTADHQHQLSGAQLDRIAASFQRTGSSAHRHHPPLPPTIDICTLDIPPGYGFPSPRTCNLRLIHEDFLREQERAVHHHHQQQHRHHVRHQKQHTSTQQQQDVDPRPFIIRKKVVMTGDQYRSGNFNFTELRNLLNSRR